MRTVLPLLLLFLLPGLPGRGQTIAGILEYTPGPGQFINTTTGGWPSSAQTLLGETPGLLSLGAFGGRVVFHFGQAVENDPDHPFGVDFTLFGNPLPHWAEPGAVWVMCDDNGNGVPDETWYELAGSDHFFSGTEPGVVVTYDNPGGTGARDIPWADDRGGQGWVLANAAHSQPHYPRADSFPSVDPDHLVLSGTRIRGGWDDRDPALVKSEMRSFGYADNRPKGPGPFRMPDNPYTPETEYAGGDAFDISWAVDVHGDYVDLDRIHFVMVKTALQGDGGWLGEVSTELTGGRITEPAPGWEGETDLLLLADLPPVIGTEPLPVEVLYFESGRLAPLPPLEWEMDPDRATLESDPEDPSEHPRVLLRALRTGELTLTVRLRDRPSLRSTQTTVVVMETASVTRGPDVENHVTLYPNPARDRVHVRGISHAAWQLYSLDGRCLQNLPEGNVGDGVSLDGISPGVYMVLVRTGETFFRKKLMIH
ncbi:MAG: T9SS type A sorting domain-containing protein [Bacteroidales bacterium]